MRTLPTAIKIPTDTKLESLLNAMLDTIRANRPRGSHSIRVSETQSGCEISAIAEASPLPFGLFAPKSVHDDYLLCRALDSSQTNEGNKDIKVLKPAELRAVNADELPAITPDVIGETATPVTYSDYKWDSQSRTVNFDEFSRRELQVLTPRYTFESGSYSQILAARCRISITDYSNGTDADPVTHDYDWIDMNLGARKWTTIRVFGEQNIVVPMWPYAFDPRPESGVDPAFAQYGFQPIKIG